MQYISRNLLLWKEVQSSDNCSDKGCNGNMSRIRGNGTDVLKMNNKVGVIHIDTASNKHAESCKSCSIINHEFIRYVNKHIFFRDYATRS